MSEQIGIAIVGGGASGLAAAITAANALQKAGSTAKAVIFERGQRVGRKLLATGNGRCNLSNRNASPEHYHGVDPDFVRTAFKRFSVKSNLDFFYKMGLLTVEEEEGKLYPKIRAILNMFPGESPVTLYFDDTKRRRGTRAALMDNMLGELKNVLGEENVVIK